MIFQRHSVNSMFNNTRYNTEGTMRLSSLQACVAFLTSWVISASSS